MTVGLQHSPIICPRCRDTGLVLIGDGYSVDRVRMCGNSVCPPLAAALVRANFGHERAWKRQEVAA